MIEIVTVDELIAGSDYPNLSYFYYQPAIDGDDYPALVKVWNNNDDKVFD